MAYVDPLILCKYFDLEAFKNFKLTSKDSLDRLNTHWINELVNLRKREGEVLYPRLLSTSSPVIDAKVAMELFRYETKYDEFKTTRTLLQYYHNTSTVHRGILKFAKQHGFERHFLKMLAANVNYIDIFKHVLKQIVETDLLSYFAGNNPYQWSLCVTDVWEVIAIYGNKPAAEAMIEQTFYYKDFINYFNFQQGIKILDIVYVNLVLSPVILTVISVSICFL